MIAHHNMILVLLQISNKILRIKVLMITNCNYANCHWYWILKLILDIEIVTDFGSFAKIKIKLKFWELYSSWPPTAITPRKFWNVRKGHDEIVEGPGDNDAVIDVQPEHDRHRCVTNTLEYTWKLNDWKIYEIASLILFIKITFSVMPWETLS